MKKSGTVIAVAFSVSIGTACFTSALAAEKNNLVADKKIKLIHIGDIHGHLIPRPNVRSDGNGRMEGGLARMYTQI